MYFISFPPSFEIAFLLKTLFSSTCLYKSVTSLSTLFSCFTARKITLCLDITFSLYNLSIFLPLLYLWLSVAYHWSHPRDTERAAFKVKKGTEHTASYLLPFLTATTETLCRHLTMPSGKTTCMDIALLTAGRNELKQSFTICIAGKSDHDGNQKGIFRHVHCIIWSCTAPATTNTLHWSSTVLLDLTVASCPA